MQNYDYEELLQYATKEELAEIDRHLIALNDADISLREYVKAAWATVECGVDYVQGWHIDAISEHLEAVTSGEILRLVINVPPGTMKSLLTCVMWPSWEWGPKRLDHYKIISTSHAEKLALRDNVKMRRLVQSSWYRAKYPHVQIMGDQNAKYKFETTKTGFREACAAASLTGSRGDRVIADDPLSVDDARSKQILETREEWFCETVPTRLISPKKSAIIVIMQRLHERDTSGVILAKNLGYEHLMLPMEFEIDRRCTTKIGFSDPRTYDGELLFPERFPREVVERDKEVMGIYAVAGQNQQRPSPRQGGIIELEFFKERYATLPDFEYYIQSWDTAFKVEQSNDYSVCTTWGIFNGFYYLVEVLRLKLKYPELKKLMIRKYIELSPLALLVEDKANGQSLIQEMERPVKDPENPLKIYKLPIKGMSANDDPVERVNAITTTLQTEVLLPIEAPWLKTYLDELCAFPAAAHDDQVHSTAHAMIFLAKNSRPKTKNADYFTR